MTPGGGNSGSIGPEVTAYVLAGGLGTRLRAVAPDRPKILAQVRGRPFVTHLLDQLEHAGLRHVILCTGHLADQVERELGSVYGELELRYSRERQPLGTGGALRLALRRAAVEDTSGSDGEPAVDTLLVMNGDSYCEVDLGAFGEAHAASGASASLALVEVDDASRYGRVELDGTGRISYFEEKGEMSRPGWINAGVYLLERSVVESVPEGHQVSIEHQVFPSLVDEGLFGFATSGRFIDIGTPESLAAAEAFFLGATP